MARYGLGRYLEGLVTAERDGGWLSLVPLQCVLHGEVERQGIELDARVDVRQQPWQCLSYALPCALIQFTAWVHGNLPQSPCGVAD